MAYVAPTPAQFKARYPEFGTVADETVQIYLTEANRSVDETWTEGDYANAIMHLAAHKMAVAGIGTGPDSVANTGALSAYSQIRSGQLSLTRKVSSSGPDDGYGGYGSTRYGREFWMLLGQNRSGPRVAVSGDFGCVSGYAKDFPFWPWAY